MHCCNDSIRFTPSLDRLEDYCCLRGFDFDSNSIDIQTWFKVMKSLPIKQFFRFCMVGVSNTLLSYIIYVGCIFIGIHYLLANAIGFFVSVLNAYYWSNRYVFVKQEGERRNHFYALLKTYITYGSSELFLASMLLYLFIEICDINEYFAQLLCLTATVPTNFLLNKYWSFAKQK